MQQVDRTTARMTPLMAPSRNRSKVVVLLSEANSTAWGRERQEHGSSVSASEAQDSSKSSNSHQLLLPASCHALFLAQCVSKSDCSARLFHPPSQRKQARAATFSA